MVDVRGQPLSPGAAKNLADKVFQFTEELGHRGSYGDAIEYVTGYSYEESPAVYLQIKREYVRLYKRKYVRWSQGPETPVGKRLPMAEVVADYEAGETIRGLSLKYGRSRSTIRRHLVRAGVTIDSDRRGQPWKPSSRATSKVFAKGE